MDRVKKNYNIIANDLINKYCERISGEDVDEYLIGEDPDERVMTGKLGVSRVTKSFDNSYKENNENRYDSIPSITVTVIISKKSSGSLKISPLGTLYYRVKPTYEQFEKYILELYSKKYNLSFDNIDAIKKYLDRTGVNDDVKLPIAYKKIQIEKYIEDGILVDINELIKSKSLSLKPQIDERLEYIVNEIINESIGGIDKGFRLSEISNKMTFNSKVDALNYESIVPNWNFDVRLEMSEIKNGYRISVTFVNLTEPSTRLGTSYSPSIFNTNIKIKGTEGVIFNDIPLEYFVSDYKNNVIVKAIPENCSCDFDEIDNTIFTEHVPIYKQSRLITKEKYSEYTSFNKLIEDPILNLKYILSEMKLDYRRIKNDEYTEFNKNQEMKKEFNKDLSLYKEEIDRFESGILLIEKYENAFKSFKYMNETFSRKLNKHSKVVKGWRLFQIVFIVSMINDITSENNSKLRDIAELLYFPTGGGKTEAFLGAVVFTMFYDRLRGKSIGISAFIKYPLRLLSINQLDRVFIVIMKAEAIRKEHNIPGEEFSIGYYVGGDNTPNKIDDINKFRGVPVETLNNEYRVIDTCPVCGEKNVDIVFVEQQWRLVHVCNNPKCDQNELPLYIVDNEIYRYLPTVIISTVDKLSVVGLQSTFKMLFGQVKKYCRLHGFSNNDKCIEVYNANCNEVLKDVPALFDPVPTLFIQDELHLVRESLGTFASHYLSFIDYYCRELLPQDQKKKIKFIGATATIAMYKNHLWNLYHKEGRRFPAAYPSTKNEGDFYSEIDKNDIARIIVGYAPYGRFVTDGVWWSTTLFRKVLSDIMKDSINYLDYINSLGFEGDVGELSKILNDYWISINYNNTKQDSLDLFNAFQNQANNFLNQNKINIFNINKMTGDDSFQEVRKILFDIQAAKNKEDCTNLILATSTISHGVDEDAFNQMYFFGMPNNNAEYVQAYSRVGRKYTGIVIDIIRLARERDRSYLKNFKLFHEHKDSLIEPVPINRWAKNAIYSTIPGLISALFIQRYNPLLKAKDVKKAINNKEITKDEFIKILIESYGCNENEKLSEAYIKIIHDEVEQIFDGFINNSDVMKRTVEQISLCSIGFKRPMSSLRDTEEQIIINLSRG